MSQRVKTRARALVLTRTSQPENDHLRKNNYALFLRNIHFLLFVTIRKGVQNKMFNIVPENFIEFDWKTICIRWFSILKSFYDFNTLLFRYFSFTQFSVFFIQLWYIIIIYEKLIYQFWVPNFDCFSATIKRAIKV